MRIARHLILSGTPVEQVAVKVGYADYSAFCRAFRQEFGCSPRQYQKNGSAK